MVDQATTAEPLPRTVTLRDGQCVVIREAQPDDKDELEAAFERLSADSRYTRFFSPVRKLPEQILDAAEHPSASHGLALVAVVDDGTPHPIIVGGSRYVLTSGYEVGEFAVTVADDRQGQGLAKLMMQTLIDQARLRGLNRMEGFILSTNRGMRGLARRLGFIDEPCPGDATVRMVHLDIQ